MSISKPTLTAVWGSSGSGNIADPGGVNATGIPSGAKSIPRRWLNWVLNKIELPIRYLIARGISDWDASESYSVGDRVQYGDGSKHTYVCIQDNTDTVPSNVSYWDRWAFTITELPALAPLAHGIHDYSYAVSYVVGDRCLYQGSTYVCIQATGANINPGQDTNHVYWQRWGYTADELTSRLGALTIQPTNGDVTATVGTVSEVNMLHIGGQYGGPGMKMLRLRVTDCGTPAGWFSITLSNTATFTGVIMGFVGGSTDISHNVMPTVVQVAGNVIEVHFGGTGYVVGAHPTIDVLLFGMP